MKVLMTSDWHLDAVTGGAERFDDLERAVNASVAYAIEQHVDLYLFLGDLCDPDPHTNARCVSFAVEVARRLAANGICSRWLVGNHDVIEDGSGFNVLMPIAAASSWPATDAPSMFQVYHSPTVEVFESLDLAIVALPFTPRCETYDPTTFLEGLEGDPLPKHVIVLSHLNVPGIVPESETKEMPRGRDVWLPVRVLKNVLGSAVFVANGHYHRPQKTDDGVHVVGSLEQLTFGEEGQSKGWLMVSTSKKGALIAKWHERDPRPLYTVGEDHPVWTEGVQKLAGCFHKIVRLRPPPGVSDELLSRVYDRLKEEAHSVKLLPPGRAEALPEERHKQAKAATARTHREVVMELANAANLDTTEERDALLKLVDDVMSKEGM